MKRSEALLLAMSAIAGCVITADLLYTSQFVPRFKELEKQRIVTSNQLATAKIVSENLNHVRELVYSNMDFAGQRDTVAQQSILFEFLTTCIVDLKMRLVSVRPSQPSVLGRVTTYGYDIQLIGDYFSLGELCSKLENSRRVMALTSFEVSEDNKESTPASIQSKSGRVPTPGRRGVTIKLHLDTYRVKKG